MDRGTSTSSSKTSEPGAAKPGVRAMLPVRLQALHQLTLVKLRELIREPEAVFWVFVFPILLALALGIAFRTSAPKPLPVAVREGPGASELLEALAASPRIEAVALDETESHAQLRAGKVALVVIAGEPWTYWFDPTRPDSRLAELEVDAVLQAAAGRRDPRQPARLELDETGSRYIDFLVPGLLGMNLMGTSLWGIGFNIVTARSRGLLERFVATPMRRSDYLLAQVLGRLLFLAVEVGVLLAFARLAFGVPIRGSWSALALVAVAGAISFGGLGLLVSSRTRTIEGVSGLMNLVMLPMWIFSGTFFSTARFPDWMQPAIQVLPLTAVNDAMRAVMLDGASLAAIGGELGIVSAWGAVSLVAAVALFRWS